MIADILVVPVHGYPVFRHLVHSTGTNLYLHQPVIQTEDRGMQRSIAIGLGVGDKIFDASLFWLPQTMDVTQGKIAIRGRLDQDAEGNQIMNLTEVSGLEVF